MKKRKSKAICFFAAAAVFLSPYAYAQEFDDISALETFEQTAQADSVSGAAVSGAGVNAVSPIEVFALPALPGIFGAGVSSAGGSAAPAFPLFTAVNPALNAGEQRVILDVSGVYLYDFSADEQAGFAGGAGKIGLLYPTRRGVISSSVGFVGLNTSKLFRTGDGGGWAAFADVSFSKDIFNNLYIGAGLSGAAGSFWSLVGNAGFVYLPGTVGVFKNVKWGFALANMGKAMGKASSALAAPFTVQSGLSADFFNTDSIVFGGAADFSVMFDNSAPYVNALFDLALQFVWKDVLSFGANWNLNAWESFFNDDKAARTIRTPAFSIAVNIKLNKTESDSFLAQNGWSRSDMAPMLAAAPLYGQVWGFGAGFNVHLGVKDEQAPEISISYPETIAFSPNNDGNQDELVFDLSILDSRYIMSWAFIVEDEDGNVVRRIENKEKRTASGFSGRAREFKARDLIEPKSGVSVPDFVRWDGTTDSGEIAEDGIYYFRLESTDDNGNYSQSPLYELEIDNTAPFILIEAEAETAFSAPSAQNGRSIPAAQTVRPSANMIFSPDGDGNKDVFVIPQKGSPEHEWRGVFYSAAGVPVREFVWTDSAPGTVEWDGRDDSGSYVPDGVYYYEITAVDKAGNRTSARMNNIIVNTEKPVVALNIERYAFSPNGDGAGDTLKILPYVSSQAGMTNWRVSIVAEDGNVVRVYDGADSVPQSILFDGLGEAGDPLKEGSYAAVFSVVYENGYAPQARSPLFALDVTAPSAVIAAESSNIAGGHIVFSPNGDGKLDVVSIKQEGSREEVWRGIVSDASGAVIREYTWNHTPASVLIWDGLDSDGKLMSDGFYTYQLIADDAAGNGGASNPLTIELSTENAQVMLHAQRSAFSPNGDGVYDVMPLSPKVSGGTAVASYALEIRDAQGAVVKSWRGEGSVPAAFNWDGRGDSGAETPDGTYSASIELTYVNGNSSSSATAPFELDRIFPEAKISADYITFSPNGDGRRDVLPLKQSSSGSDDWSASITDASSGALVRSWNWSSKLADVEWDGNDGAGNRARDGKYVYTLTSQDAAGNKTVYKIENIVLDTRAPKAYVTLSRSGISPNGDGVCDTQAFSIMTTVQDGISGWTFAITDADGKNVIRSWSGDGAVPALIEWDGFDESGAAVYGSVAGRLDVDYEKGDAVTTTTASFIVNARAPQLAVQLKPRYFSPDNDGADDELYISLSANSIAEFAEWSFEVREPTAAAELFWRTGGTGSISEQLIWDGRSNKGELVQAATDYPYTFTVKDVLGNVAVAQGYIPVDVLVIRDGDQLKIQVPSIIFREDHADFIGLPQETVDKNNQVLKRVAEILNKFRDYRVTIEGHANNVTGTRREEEEELLPLSQLRAEEVKRVLNGFGVAESRLSTMGMGGTRPVVSRDDRANWWKNRRVEFILIK